MKKAAYTREDALIRWIVLPVFIPVLNSFLLGRTYWADWRTWAGATGISFALFFGHWFVNNTISLQFNRLFPAYRQTPQRLLFSIPTLMLSSGLTTVASYGLYVGLRLPGVTFAYARLQNGLLFVCLTVLIVSTIYESINAFELWQRTLVEAEQLKKAALQSQFESLKQQVNPHFLFNSLNSLGALIEEDPDHAQDFLDELSSVYRYLLRANEEPLTALSNELDFIRSYFYLLRVRYGSSVEFVESVDPALGDSLIPPLTLQLLVENAVKHNVLLPDQPLRIHITAPGNGQLLVQNSLQRKVQRVVSNKVGIATILSRYELLRQPAPVIRDDGQFFSVWLPLIHPSYSPVPA